MFKGTGRTKWVFSLWSRGRTEHDYEEETAGDSKLEQQQRVDIWNHKLEAEGA